MTSTENIQDLNKENERKIEMESIIFVCAEGRMHCVRNNKIVAFTDLNNLVVRTPSKSRIQRGFWGSYGDVPLIIGRRENGKLTVNEHAQHPFEYFEIVGRPVKRLCGHSTWLPPELESLPPAYGNLNNIISKPNSR